MEYAIVDIETTGGFGAHNKITEIAVIIHDGKQELERFSSLVNPEGFIPAQITALTGITNEMVENAPKFYELAKQVWELTEGRIFVAHNVGFDYNVIRDEFKQLGAKFQRKKLCTVRLSRQVFKNLPSYSLGNLCESLGIPLQNRHRALGDTEATALLFKKIVTENGLDEIERQLKVLNKETKIPSNLNADVYHNLPENTGVYYFYNETGEVIYVGKAKNIKSRITSHFTNADASSRKQNMLREIADISYELTGSELVALLLESDEIKKLEPKFNRAQKRTVRKVGLLQYTDQNGYIRLAIDKNTKLKAGQLLNFANIPEARKFLFDLLKSKSLCQKMLGLETGPGACFDYHISSCKGACLKEEDPASYNERLLEGLNEFTYAENDLLIKGKGRDEGEFSVVLVEKGSYKGFGFFDVTENYSVEDIKEGIDKKNDNRDIFYIIKGYMKKNKVDYYLS